MRQGMIQKAQTSHHCSLSPLLSLPSGTSGSAGEGQEVKPKEHFRQWLSTTSRGWAAAVCLGGSRRWLLTDMLDF